MPKQTNKRVYELLTHHFTHEELHISLSRPVHVLGRCVVSLRYRDFSRTVRFSQLSPTAVARPRLTVAIGRRQRARWSGRRRVTGTPHAHGFEEKYVNSLYGWFSLEYCFHWGTFKKKRKKKVIHKNFQKQMK